MGDAWVRHAARVLTLLALVAFLTWISSLQPIALLAAIVVATGAYAFFLIDRSRHAEPLAGPRREGEDRVMDGSETAVVPGVSVGGIHMSYESRTRWRAKR